MARLSKEAEYEFTESHIPKVWEFLHDTFGFNLKHWKAEFQAYLQKHPRDTSEVSVFYRFGNERIEPLLNRILGRREHYSTFNGLVEFVVTGRRQKKE